MAPSSTVVFNVGGMHYEVSQSLLDQYPDTMLARMASETWRRRVASDDNGNVNADGSSETHNDHDNNNDSREALFIERNGNRFQYILDYMRDGKIFLPAAGYVSKMAVWNELEYFGFALPDDSHNDKDNTSSSALDAIIYQESSVPTLSSSSSSFAWTNTMIGNTGPYQVNVSGAGTDAVNGIYHQDGYWENACKYSKIIPKWQGATQKVSIYILHTQCLEDQWQISIHPRGNPEKQGAGRIAVDFYHATVVTTRNNSNSNQQDWRRREVPPQMGWKRGKGEHPPPKITYVGMDDE